MPDCICTSTDVVRRMTARIRRMCFDAALRRDADGAATCCCCRRGRAGDLVRCSPGGRTRRRRSGTPQPSSSPSRGAPTAAAAAAAPASSRAMEEPAVLSLKQLAACGRSSARSPSSAIAVGVAVGLGVGARCSSCGGARGSASGRARLWGRRATYCLLQMALLYLALVCATWLCPPLYHRISETGQAVVVTLVDSASIELQNRASPALARDADALNSSRRGDVDGGGDGHNGDGGAGLLNDSSASAPAATPRPPLRDKGTGTALPSPPPRSPAPSSSAAAAAVEHPPAPGAAAAAEILPAAGAGDAHPPQQPSPLPPVPEAPQPGGAAAAASAAPTPAPDAAEAAAALSPPPPPAAIAAAAAAAPNATEKPQPQPAAAAEDIVDANGTLLPRDQQYVVRAEPKVVEGDAGAEAAAAAAEGEAPTDAVANAPAPAAVAATANATEAEDVGAAAEDIPSFSEWAQRQLAEAEEKKKVLNASAGGPGGGGRPSGGGSGGAGGGGAAAGANLERGGGGGGGGSGGDGGGKASAGGGGGSGGGSLKLRSKNYASPDCGAKIVAANAESVSPGAVLSSSRDEYMLNTCTTRVWFVVELCEAIQAKKIELANFELFSSSPREFAVSVSDRVQGREWRPAGHFAASEERAVQSFALSPQQFGRYVKVEVLSHHGSEHFCPLSLFRVYGTSEFEVLEKVDQAADDEDGSAAGAGRLGLEGDDEDDDEDEGAASGDDEDVPLGAGPADPPRNLFESYKNAVLSIVKKAAQALTKAGDESNETAASEVGAGAGAVNETTATEDQALAPPPTSASPAADTTLCKSPRHLVVCDNCSDALYGEVFSLLSCRERDLEVLLSSSAFVSSAVREGGGCARFGLQLATRRAGAPFPLPAAADAARSDPAEYLRALLPPAHVAALCNLLAVADRRVALNVSDLPNGTAPTPARARPAAARPPAPTPAPAPATISPAGRGLEGVVPAVTCTREGAPGGGAPSASDAACRGGDATAAPHSHLAAQIKPTKTLARAEVGEDTALPPGVALEGSVASHVQATYARPAPAPAQPPAPEETAAGSTGAAAAPPPPTVVASLASATATANASAAPPASAAAGPAGGDGERDAAAPGVTVASTPAEPADAEGAEGDAAPASSEDAAHENLDSLLRDLKSLEQGAETAATGAGAVINTPTPPSAAPAPSPSSASAPAPAATTTPSPQATAKATPQTPSVQKESVFVRLANRIKALERNMSLSGQYLEELSRRYKKQVEEMQKAFNRTLQVVHEASRIGEEREARRQEEMQQLQQQLSQLSETLQGLIGERDSWLSRLNVIAQHLILICVEVLLFVLLMYFCRRIPDSSGTSNEEISQKQNLGIRSRKGSRAAVKRRRSVEGVSGHESPRTRNRRPSEEALLIAGSYQDLLISEPGVSEIDGLHNISRTDARRRRRKKKDLLSRSASIRLPVKSSETLVDTAKEQKSVSSRRASSLELGVWWASSNGVDTAIEEDEKVQKDSEVLLHHQQGPTEQTYLDCSHSPAIESISPHSSVTDMSSQQLKDSQRQIKSSNINTSEVHTKFRSVSDTVSPLTKNNGLVRSNALGSVVQRQLSSPVFMRTATSVRSSRLGSGSVEPSPPAKLKSDNWEWYSTHHGLDKSSQPNKVTCSISCPRSGPVDPNQRQNGHSAPDDTRRSSNASSSASSTSNISEGTSHKEASKKGPSGLKKMVKKFF